LVNTSVLYDKIQKDETADEKHALINLSKEIKKDSNIKLLSFSSYV